VLVITFVYGQPPPAAMLAYNDVMANYSLQATDDETKTGGKGTIVAMLLLSLYCLSNGPTTGSNRSLYCAECVL